MTVNDATVSLSTLAIGDTFQNLPDGDVYAVTTNPLNDGNVGTLRLKDGRWFSNGGGIQVIPRAYKAVPA